MGALLSIRLMPIVYAILAGGMAVGIFWLVDEIGDRRERKVRAEYAEAARKKNVDIGHFNTAEEALGAVVDAKVKEARRVAGSVASTHKATAEQADALNAIRRAGQ